jgi:hypothetical protein
MADVKEKAWLAYRLAERFADEKMWIMVCLPIVFGEDPQAVIDGRMCSKAGLLIPEAWGIALDERFASKSMFHADRMPAPACRMSHALLGWAGFTDASRVLKRLPLAVGAAVRHEVNDKTLVFATRPDVLNLDRLKRWFGATLLAAEAFEIRSIAIPMPIAKTDEDALAIAATLVSEARGHHGNLHNIWPMFANDAQRRLVLDWIDEWVKEDFGNFDSFLAKQEQVSHSKHEAHNDFDVYSGDRAAIC